MPLGKLSQLRGTDPVPRQFVFPDFARGLNNFSLDSEISSRELSYAKNIEIVGKGAIHFPRRGIETFAEKASVTSVDGLFHFKNSTVNELLAITGTNLKRLTEDTLTAIDDTVTW